MNIINNIIDIYEKIVNKYPFTYIKFFLDDEIEISTNIPIYNRKYRLVGSDCLNIYWIESMNRFHIWVRHTIDFQDMLLAKNAFNEIIKEKNYYQNIKRGFTERIRK